MEDYHLQQACSNIHIGGILNQLSHDKVLIHAGQMPYDIIDMLKNKGYGILNLPFKTEKMTTFACNSVALEPNYILMAEGKS